MIITLTGKNEFEIDEKLAEICDQAISTNQRLIERLDAGEVVETNNFINNLQMVSLFSESRLIILRHISDNKPLLDQIIKYSGHIAEDITLVIVDSSLDLRTKAAVWLKKNSQWFNFKPLNAQQLGSWLKQACQKLGIQLSYQQQARLLAKTGDNQLLVWQELKKLQYQKGAISDELLDALVPATLDDNIFEFLDAICSGYRERAIHQLDNLKLSKTDPHYIFNLLVWQFNVLSTALFSDLSIGSIAEKTGLKETSLYKARKLRSQMSRSRLRQFLELIADIDMEMKKTNAWMQIDRLLTV